MVSREIREGFPTSPDWLSDKYITFRNRSALTAWVAPEATRAAMRLAVILQMAAPAASPSMMSPHTKIKRRSPAGITTSIIRASTQGRHRSRQVPVNLIQNPTVIRR